MEFCVWLVRWLGWCERWIPLVGMMAGLIWFDMVSVGWWYAWGRKWWIREWKRAVDGCIRSCVFDSYFPFSSLHDLLVFLYWWQLDLVVKVLEWTQLLEGNLLGSYLAAFLTKSWEAYLQAFLPSDSVRIVLPRWSAASPWPDMDLLLSTTKIDMSSQLGHTNTSLTKYKMNFRSKCSSTDLVCFCVFSNKTTFYSAYLKSKEGERKAPRRWQWVIRYKWLL